MVEDFCPNCGAPIHGGFVNLDPYTRRDGTVVIAIDTTPDRDWGLCDACNDQVCQLCSPNILNSGYCNDCDKRFGR